MPEFGPLSSIIGAVIGASITALVGYFLLQKRKRLRFYIGPEEDLTSALQKNHPFVSVKVGDKETSRLFKRNVWVKNHGNATVSGLSFDLIVDGMHGFFTVKVSAEDVRLRNEVKLEFRKEETPPDVDPYVSVSTPFVNVGEQFQLTALYDGRDADVRISCRVEDVAVKVKKGSRDAPPLGLIQGIKELLSENGGAAVQLLATAIAGLAALAGLIGVIR
jgi:hypothetical protein